MSDVVRKTDLKKVNPDQNGQDDLVRLLTNPSILNTPEISGIYLNSQVLARLTSSSVRLIRSSPIKARARSPFLLSSVLNLREEEEATASSTCSMLPLLVSILKEF